MTIACCVTIHQVLAGVAPSDSTAPRAERAVTRLQTVETRELVFANGRLAISVSGETNMTLGTPMSWRAELRNPGNVAEWAYLPGLRARIEARPGRLDRRGGFHAEVPAEAFGSKSGVGGWVLLAPGAAYSMLVQNLLLEDCTVSVSVRYANKQEKPARDGNACWKGDTQFAVQLIGSCCGFR